MTNQQFIQQKEQKEEKNKKRGLYITIGFHVVLVALAFFPIMNAIQEAAEEPHTIELVSAQDLKDNAVEFVANAETKTRKNSSTRQESSPTVTPVPSKVTPEPEPTPQEVVEETLPTEVVEDVEAPVITPSEVVSPTPVVNNTPTKVETQTTTKTTNSNTKGTTIQSGGNATNNTSNSGDGGNAEDMQEGVFGRKVTQRPNIKGLTKTSGKIVIKVCVSQEGTVIAAQYVQSLSTITDPTQVANAVRAAKRYKFDVDYTSPKKQWGKLSFIFNMRD